MSRVENIRRRARRGISFAGRVFLRWASDSQVLGGPFAGLRYGIEAGGSVYAAKILGTYELELAPIVNQWPGLHLTRAIDVGAAEGYYAVGVARWLGIPVTAFELEAESRTLLANMARLNGVSTNIKVCGACDTDALSLALAEAGGQRQLLICDVEGFELDLLDPERIPALTETWILAEMHDCFRPGCTEELVRRFSPTHRIERIKTRARTPMDFPPTQSALRHLPGPVKVRFMSEGRPGPMDWLWMAPKSNPGSAQR